MGGAAAVFCKPRLLGFLVLHFLVFGSPNCESRLLSLKLAAPFLLFGFRDSLECWGKNLRVPPALVIEFCRVLFSLVWAIPRYILAGLLSNSRLVVQFVLRCLFRA